MQCVNPNCKYLIEMGKKNELQMDGEVICSFCGEIGITVECKALKLMEADPHARKIRVYHWRDHVCQPDLKVSVKSSTRQKLVGFYSDHPRAKPREAGSKLFVEAIQDQRPLEEVLHLVGSSALGDKHWMYNVKRSSVPNAGEDNSFEAILRLKEQLKTYDEFLIYKVNDSRVDDSNPDFVMKSSEDALRIALEMDRGTGCFGRQTAFVDFKATRCPGFKTLTLSTLHEPLSSIISLATMEIPSENANAVKLFFTLFNEMLSAFAKEQRTFDPHLWCADEAGSIRVGLVTVSPLFELIFNK